MLIKMKDDVDFKQLEKFGYEYDKLTNEWTKSLILEGYSLFVVIHENGIITIVSNFGDDAWSAESGDIGVSDIENAGLTENY